MILNCTNHTVTEKQIIMGIIEPDKEDKEILTKTITFEEIPDKKTLEKAASLVASMVKKYNCKAGMIGGAPYLQGYLEKELFDKGLKVAFAFSKRVSKEEHLPDGSVKKEMVFDSSNTLIKDAEGNIEIISCE